MGQAAPQKRRPPCAADRELPGERLSQAPLWTAACRWDRRRRRSGALHAPRTASSWRAPVPGAAVRCGVPDGTGGAAEAAPSTRRGPRAPGERLSQAPLWTAACRWDRRRRRSGALQEPRTAGFRRAPVPGAAVRCGVPMGQAAPQKRRPPRAADRELLDGARPRRRALRVQLPRPKPVTCWPWLVQRGDAEDAENAQGGQCCRKPDLLLSAPSASLRLTAPDEA